MLFIPFPICSIFLVFAKDLKNRLDSVKNFAIALAFLLLVPCFAFAKYMAVLETLSPNDLLTRQEKLYLTDILRGQAVYILPAEQNWTIMTRENINVMLPPGKTIEECEGSCLAETRHGLYHLLYFYSISFYFCAKIMKYYGQQDLG